VRSPCAQLGFELRLRITVPISTGGMK